MTEALEATCSPAHGASEQDQQNQLVTCVGCISFSLRRSTPDLARHGFGHCLKRSLTQGHTFSAHFKRVCPGFAQADLSAVDRRIEWLRQQETR